MKETPKPQKVGLELRRWVSGSVESTLPLIAVCAWKRHLNKISGLLLSNVSHSGL